MYNLENLNDIEFEALAQSIMQKRLKTKLHRFKRGRDGGVDLCDSGMPMTYMIQVKHYTKSSLYSLMSNLSDEIEKVKKQNPKQYFVFCSMDLTLKNKNDIVDMFPNYMTDISHVIDKTEIDDFLNDKENEDILSKHFKLWFYSADLLNKLTNFHGLIDCEILLDNIENEIKYYVKTKSYHEALKKTVENNVVILLGSPGVGKTTISKMIILHYLAKEYEVRFVSNNNIKDLKNTLSKSPEKKEIILIDDFLGQHYLDIEQNIPTEIQSLIAYIEMSPTKKLILNSRITILNEAKQKLLMSTDK